MSVASSPKLAEAVAKMLYEDRERDDVTDVEKVQLASCYGAIIERIYLAYEQQKEGILSPEEGEAVYRPDNAWMTTRYLRSFWPRARAAWPPDFAD